jgi:phosphoribosylglycinamide formyltransferase-1
MKRVGVLVSGGGTNLQAILDAERAGHLPGVAVAVVVSNVAGAGGLARAEKAGVPGAVIEHRRFPDRPSFEAELARVLDEYRVDLVALAGFMRVLTGSFLARYPGRVINIHPALLPCFPGTHGQKQAFDHGVRFTGCTTHFVDEGTDTGPIILQAVVPVLPDDTLESLSARILAEEHRIYPETIRLWAEGRLTVRGRKVVIAEKKS